MTETLTTRIIRHEGLVLTPYRDTLGNWTIGAGHKLTPDQAQQYAGGITQDEALTLLNSDISLAQAELAKDLPWTLDLPQFKQDILTEMVFQIGMNGVLGFKNFLFCARSGDDAGAAQDMLDSLWHRQTPGRCEELSMLWQNPPPTSTS